jgi:AraC family transcriptional regulator
MLTIDGHLLVPLDRPPTPAGLAGGFGSGTHGHRGPEPYRNGFWVLNIARGRGGVLRVHGREFPFHDGCAVLAPPDVDHIYHFHGPTHKTYAHFRTAPTARAAPIAVVSHLGDHAEWYKTTILTAARVVTAEPARATAMLWQMLFTLSTGPVGGDTPVHHPVIRALLAHLSEHLAEPTDPMSLARRLGCSPTHLNRLCRAAFGRPLLSYVRLQRLERAEYLLRQTTTPIADIAATVGYDDLQHFNKLMRRHAGRSPRGLREG